MTDDNLDLSDGDVAFAIEVFGFAIIAGVALGGLAGVLALVMG